MVEATDLKFGMWMEYMGTSLQMTNQITPKRGVVGLRGGGVGFCGLPPISGTMKLGT